MTFRFGITGESAGHQTYIKLHLKKTIGTMIIFYGFYTLHVSFSIR